MHDRLRHRLSHWWAQLIARRPRLVLIFVLLATLVAIIVTVVGVRFGPDSRFQFGPLRFRTDRNELIAADLEWNQRFIDWQSNFSGTHDLIVVVDAAPTGEPITSEKIDRARSLVDDLCAALLPSELVVQAVGRFKPGENQDRALRLLPEDDFRRRLDQIASLRPVLGSPTLDRLIDDVLNRLTQPMQVASSSPATGLDQLTYLMEAVCRRIVEEGEDSNLVSLLNDGKGDVDHVYFHSPNHRLFFIRVTPYRDPNVINELADSIASIRQIVQMVGDRHPGFEVGLTGRKVVEADEVDAATFDTTLASIVALALITALLVLAFQSWRMPLLLATSLLFALAWSFGFLTIAIGYLQVLSVVFTIILLGLGITYGIHLASRFELIRHQYSDDRNGFEMALADCFRTMGPGVITGCLTTAAAFVTMLWTDFKGAAEMGLIAAMGVLLCLVAMFTVFPCLLRLMRSKHRHVVPMHDRWIHFFEDRWVLPFGRRPRLTLVIVGMITVVSLFGISRMTFDYNLMKLQPRCSPSVLWQERIVANSPRSIWHAVSVAPNLSEARRRTEAFRRLDTVGSVEGIAMLFPEDDPIKRHLIDQLRQELGTDLDNAAGPIVSRDPMATAKNLGHRISTLQLFAMQAAGRGLSEGVMSVLRPLSDAIERSTLALASLAPEQRMLRLQRVANEYEQWRQAIAQRAQTVLDSSPLRPDDLPTEIVGPYWAGFACDGGDGRVVLEIYPEVLDTGSGPLDPVFLQKFFDQLSNKGLDPNITGPIVQIYRSGTLIKNSYIKAGIFALVVVVLLLWLDFRSISDACLCLVPVGVGFALTFGVMQLIGMSINPANIIVLPVMFGIGVDSGVHILHRYRHDPNRRPLGLSHGTGKGITIASLTTVIGFACMLLARHRGIFDLGFVLALGVLMTMLACWIVMPAWLELRCNVSRPTSQVPIAPVVVESEEAKVKHPATGTAGRLRDERRRIN